MAVVVAGLQVLGDVGKGTQVLWVLCRTGNVPDLVLRNDILPGKCVLGLAVSSGHASRLPYLFTSLELQANPTLTGFEDRV